eukprot:223253-Chlamydomonas_euryale.AAC.2
MGLDPTRGMRLRADDLAVAGAGAAFAAAGACATGAASSISSSRADSSGTQFSPSSASLSPSSSETSSSSSSPEDSMPPPPAAPRRRRRLGGEPDCAAAPRWPHTPAGRAASPASPDSSDTDWKLPPNCAGSGQTHTHIHAGVHTQAHVGKAGRLSRQADVLYTAVHCGTLRYTCRGAVTHAAGTCCGTHTATHISR